MNRFSLPLLLFLALCLSVCPSLYQSPPSLSLSRSLARSLSICVSISVSISSLSLPLHRTYIRPIIAMPSIPSELIVDVERTASCRRLLLLQQPDVINEPQWSNQCKDGEVCARGDVVCGDIVSAALTATFPLRHETSVPSSKSDTDYHTSAA